MIEPTLMEVAPGLVGWMDGQNDLTVAGYAGVWPPCFRRLRGAAARASLRVGVTRSRVHRETRGYAAVFVGTRGFFLRQGYHFNLVDGVTLDFPALDFSTTPGVEERAFWHPFTAPVHVGPIDLDAVAADLAHRQPTWFDAVRPRDVAPTEFKDSPRFRRYVAHLARRHHIDSATLASLRGIFDTAHTNALSLARQRRPAYADY